MDMIRYVHKRKENEMVIIEATKKDGTRQLIPDTLIRSFAHIAANYSKGKKSAERRLDHILANFMYCGGYTSLVEICYSSEGQKRTLIIWKGRRYR